MRCSLALAAFFVLLNACQYPVGTSTLPDQKRFLIIDAELTQDHGKVHLYYTLDEVTPQGAYLFPPPPENASAYVLDSQGNRTDFAIDGSFNYNFHGVTGEVYRLFASADGQTYESAPESMPVCPEIDSLTVKYTEERTRSPKDLSYYGFDVYAEATDIPNQANYYQWDWVHYERAVGCSTVFENGQLVLYPCNPVDCWNIAYNKQIIVQSDQLRDGKPLARKIVRVPFTRPPSKYYLRIEQRAITPSVFTYLQSVDAQTQHTGSAFDVPAQTRFNPNVHNVNDPDEKLLGVFSVYSYRRKVVYIDRSQEIDGRQAITTLFYLPFTSLPLAFSPCVEGLYRTQTRPQDWHD